MTPGRRDGITVPNEARTQSHNASEATFVQRRNEHTAASTLE